VGGSVDGTKARAIRERWIDLATAIAVAPAVLLHTLEALGINERLAALALDASQSFRRDAGGIFELISRASMLCFALSLAILVVVPRLVNPGARAIASVVALVLALGLWTGSGVSYVASAAAVGGSVVDHVSDTLARYFTVGAIATGLLGAALVVGALSVSPIAARSPYAARGLAAAAWIGAAGAVAGVGLYGFVVMKVLWGVYFVATPSEIVRHTVQAATALACLAMALSAVFGPRPSAGAAEVRPVAEPERVSSAA
jgi:hypothetical protein